MTVAEGICQHFTHEACLVKGCQAEHVPASAQFWDTHCHLDRLEQHHRVSYMDIDFPPNFAGLITNFIDPQHYRLMDKILLSDKVYGTVGYHPQHASHYSDDLKTKLTTLLKHPKVLAVGETGLDCKHASHTPLEMQVPMYRLHLELARRLDKPLVLHCRDTHDDMLAIARQMLSPEQPIHLHCFTGTSAQATAWLSSFPNLKIGLTNLITTKSMRELRDAVRTVPLQSLLLETDAPYMFPKNLGRNYPYKFTHPGMSLNVAVEIAKIKGLGVTEVINVTTENCKATYRL